MKQVIEKQEVKQKILDMSNMYEQDENEPADELDISKEINQAEIVGAQRVNVRPFLDFRDEAILLQESIRQEQFDLKQKEKLKKIANQRFNNVSLVNS